MNPTLKSIGIILLSGITGYFFMEALESKILIPNNKKKLSLSAPKLKQTILDEENPKSENIKNILNKPLSNKQLIGISEYIQTIDENQVKEMIKQCSSYIPIALLFERWGELNPKAALRQSARERRNLFDYSIFNAWFKKDPQAALAFYHQDNNLSNNKEITKLIARQKLSENTIEGFQWIIDTMDSKKDKDYFTVFNDYVLTKPPQDIYNDISQMKLSPEMRDNILKTIATQWALQDWDKTKSWLNTLSPQDKGVAYSSALEYYATKKPLDALSEITQDDIKTNESVIYSVLPFLYKDPSIPAEWITQNYKLDNPRGLENITRTWIMTEPEKCMAFLDKFPVSNIKKNAIINLLEFGEHVTLLKKISYYQQIEEDPKTSKNEAWNAYYHIEKNIYASYTNNGKATKKWINESNLPAQKKESIIENLSMHYTKVP